MKKLITTVFIGMLVLTILPTVMALEPTNQELKMDLLKYWSMFVAIPSIDNFMNLKTSIFNIFDRLDYYENSRAVSNCGNSPNRPTPIIEVIEGDLDSDGDVDLDDWVLYKQRWTALQNSNATADDFSKFKQEYSIFQENFGK